MISLLLASAALVQPAPAATTDCERAAWSADCRDGTMVVTAALVPVPETEAPASVTLFTAPEIEAQGLSQVSDLIRLTPGTSVSASGGPGAQTQIRIRGAEANHTLVFIDGIAFNDLAANNQARFETFQSAGLGRLELVRGPQSALWGSEALGGVVAMETPDPLGEFRGAISAEAGSRGFIQTQASAATGGDNAGLSATASFVRSDGIDTLGGGIGDRDGFDNLTLSLKGVVRFGDGFEAGGVGRYIDHNVDFDGSDPVTFARADTADSSTAQTIAGRAWLRYGDADTPWQARIEAQHLDSDNRNRTGTVRTNDSYGQRTRFGGQVSRRITAGDTRHLLIVAAEHEEEKFGTRDLQFGGASDRDLDRSRTAFVGGWRAEWSDLLITDIAVRHDNFSTFDDATTFRAHAELKLGGGFSVVGGYGEGIAQPSFVDLFGFGPGSGFIGNPNLRPERSTGYEGGVRWSRPNLSLEAVAFSNDLQDEIVEDFSIFPNYTVVNAPGESRRRGIELSGEWRPVQGLRLAANYTYSDTRELNAGAGNALREVRRPEHTANLLGDYTAGRLTVGGALAYVGERIDSDFDLFPAPRLTLDAYVLASARVAYQIVEGLEAFARIENAFDEDYQDVVGYATQGRSLYAGLRFRFGD